MENNILKRAKKIHLIGIGGTGVSGLAKLLLDNGKVISGSDNNPSSVLRELQNKKVKIFTSQKESNIDKNIQLIIYSQAILPDNPEFKKAADCKIPLISYPQALGYLMEEKEGVAVAGTHGKTTTSALIVTILKKSGLSPSYLIGGEIKGKGNSGAGKGKFLVAEACEFKESFLYYHPKIAVVTNIEKDHLDYYRNINEIKRAFTEFLNNVKEDGIRIYCADDKNTREVIKRIKGNKVSYGLLNGDWRASRISIFRDYVEFDCSYKGKKTDRIKAKVKGLHNIANSLAAIAVCREAGVSLKDIKDGLESFSGVHRRCEILEELKGITFVDDYGHHPREIQATLKCLKQIFPQRRLVVVFQPHQYSRTRFLLKDFASSFSLAEKVIVPDIYFVRDSILEKKMVNAQILVDRIRKNGKEALYLPTFDEISEYLAEILKTGDVLLTIGAGPVDNVAKKLLKKLKRRN
jgi:UDP-N-acetylmuramate--alanine ligase